MAFKLIETDEGFAFATNNAELVLATQHHGCVAREALIVAEQAIRQSRNDYLIGLLPDLADMIDVVVEEVERSRRNA